LLFLQPLAKELGIKVVPTFKILKGGKVVKEVTGAKIDELAEAIETANKRSQADKGIARSTCSASKDEWMIDELASEDCE
jgi:hypothetical protein